ncbi:MAG: FliM/FliN family flagellar motor switch protein [Geopsychrobacter sp.]|nr:FliM/FliN family flagellar motor switch protein [Geopsychrobacter sp.]
MERILSKDEIADLLSAVRHGDVEIETSTDETSTAARVSRVDLFRSQGPENWKLPNIDLILEAFGRNYSNSLASRLQQAVAAKLSGFESMSFGSLLQKLSGRGAIGIFELEPLRGSGMVIFDEAISFALVELVLGGSSDSETIPDRAMTAIELNVIQDVVSDSCSDLEKSFVQMLEIKASLVKIESNLRLINHLSDDAGVLVARYSLSLDTTEGQLLLVLPHSALEPLVEKQREKAVPMSAVRVSQWQQSVQGELDMMEVEVEAQLAQITLRVRDILNFQVGDVIDLNCGPDSPLKLLVEGRPKFKGIAGVQARKKAILVTGSIPDGG